MSDQTVQAIEDAIEAHFRDELTDDDSEARRSSVIINWVVGITISNVVNVDGEDHVGYSNDWYAATGDINAAIGLAGWVKDEITLILRPLDD